MMCMINDVCVFLVVDDKNNKGGVHVALQYSHSIFSLEGNTGGLQ